MVSKHPRWKATIFADGMGTAQSNVGHNGVSSRDKDRRLLPAVKANDLTRLVGQYIERGKASDHGNRLKELLNAGLVVELLGLV